LTDTWIEYFHAVTFLTRQWLIILQRPIVFRSNTASASKDERCFVWNIQVTWVLQFSK